MTTARTDLQLFSIEAPHCVLSSQFSVLATPDFRFALAVTRSR